MMPLKADIIVHGMIDLDVTRKRNSHFTKSSAQIVKYPHKIVYSVPLKFTDLIRIESLSGFDYEQSAGSQTF